MSNKDNRKGVYFSKSNQDVKEYVDDHVIDFTAYVIDLIRKDMNGDFYQSQQIHQELHQLTQQFQALKESIESVQRQPIQPLYSPMFYPSQPTAPLPTAEPERDVKEDKKSEKKRKNLRKAATFGEED